jgi:steroid 5-alpha reductase family enzyme
MRFDSQIRRRCKTPGEDRRWEALMQKVQINLRYAKEFIGIFDEDTATEAEARIFYDDD